jgi:lipoprotein-releasing system permease protein
VPFELRIALRYLKARRKQAFISVISGVSALGVTVGVMALMIALALMNGFQGEIRERILGSTAHITIFGTSDEGIENYAEVMAKVQKLPHVLGAAPAIYGQSLIASASRAQAATIKGIVPRLETTVTEIGRQVQNGGLAALDAATEDGPPPILLGYDLAASLHVRRGDIVTITSPNGRLSPLGLLPRVSRFRVAGTVRSELFEFDSIWCYVSLAEAQRLFGYGDRAKQIEVRTDDIYAAREIGDAIVAALGPDYVTSDWIQLNGSLFAALWIEKIVIGGTIGLIVMVAALNIVATLILMVMEKHKDIAILVSMGAARRSIQRIFMLQGMLIGAVGTAIGGFLGWLIGWVLDRYQIIKVPADVYQISSVPFKLQPYDAALVVAGALVVCFLATLYPSWGAARLDPAEALRYE